MDYPHELTAQQRAALVTARLKDGQRLTNAQIREMCGYMDTSAAYRLMMQIAALHADLALAYIDGEWRIMKTPRRR